MAEQERSVTIEFLCNQHQIFFDDLVKRSELDEGRVRAIVESRWTPSPVERKRIADVFGVAPSDIRWGHATPIQHIHGPG